MCVEIATKQSRICHKRIFMYCVKQSMIVEVASYVAKYTQRVIFCVFDTSMYSLLAIKIVLCLLCLRGCHGDTFIYDSLKIIALCLSCVLYHAYMGIVS